MTMKGLLRKQVIVPISKDNVDNIMVSANEHITNINRAFKMSNPISWSTSFV